MGLQELGHEYGTTTGRRRRCGWLDIALVKYSALVNGFDSINITKLDVLTGLKRIRIAISYRNKQMTEVRLPRGYFPSHLEDLKEVVCEYETMEGWSEDISRCTQWAQLPLNAKRYVMRIQELLDIPVSWVGVGPDRASMLKVNVPLKSIDADAFADAVREPGSTFPMKRRSDLKINVPLKSTDSPGSDKTKPHEPLRGL